MIKAVALFIIGLVTLTACLFCTFGAGVETTKGNKMASGAAAIAALLLAAISIALFTFAGMN